jgi:formylglycine-generating enzyme required for sulfatase activity
VVGICWYEARAYLSWLTAQSGLPFQLPSEVEWEAAARGLAGRRHAYGDTFDPTKGNTTETHIRRTTPIGVFPEGDTSEGVADLTGNTLEWTSSAFGRTRDTSEFPYPYEPNDGREDPELPASYLRVLRGGSWSDDRSVALAAYRVIPPPGNRAGDNGLRVVVRRV